MEYLKVDADAVSQAITEMVREEIAKTVRAQVRKLTPKQYELKEMMEDIIQGEVYGLLRDEVKKFKEDVLKPKVTSDVQEMIDRTDVLKKSCDAVPAIVVKKMEEFEMAVFERVMKAKFRDPEKPIAYEFHDLMAKYITRAYEKPSSGQS